MLPFFHSFSTKKLQINYFFSYPSTFLVINSHSKNTLIQFQLISQRGFKLQNFPHLWRKTPTHFLYKRTIPHAKNNQTTKERFVTLICFTSSLIDLNFFTKGHALNKPSIQQLPPENYTLKQQQKKYPASHPERKGKKLPKISNYPPK